MGEAESCALLHAASTFGDTAGVRALLDSGVEAHLQEEEGGVSALMLAAGAGHAEIVGMLLEAGAPWNAVDRKGRCAGNHALDNGHQQIVDFLVDAAVRSEMLLAAAERGTRRAAESAEYLSRGVRYDGDTLFDESDDAVMMQWEAPLMQAHADRLCASRGDVLNVGFGMGIIDGMIAQKGVRSHTIIEAHPGVLARIQRDGWHDRENVRICEGRWQDCVPSLIKAGVRFDAIFYDTYGEHDSDMAEFHNYLPELLREGGLYSFFNGMCPFNVFFQGVACAVVQLELQALAFEVAFEPMEIATPESDDDAWRGVKRQYFYADTYYLPHCVLSPNHGAGSAAADAAQPDEAADDDASHVGGGSAARQLVSLNGCAIRLISRSLGSSDDGAGLRGVLAEAVMPHFEDAGWALLAPLQHLWAAEQCAMRDAAPYDAAPASFTTSSLASRSEYDASLALREGERANRERAAAASAILHRQASAVAEASGLDDNSRAVLQEVVRVAAVMASGHGPPIQEEELCLSIVPNPLASESMAVDDGAAGSSGTLAAAGGADTDTGGDAVPGGRDSQQRRFTTVDEFWDAQGGGGLNGAASSSAGPSGSSSASGGSSGGAWYGCSSSYWAGVRADVDGMLGGLGELHAPDVTGSLAFLDRLRADAETPLPTGVALDCGAGIGRVSESVLLHRFQSVDLLEPNEQFLATARQQLPRNRVRAMHHAPLQGFKAVDHMPRGLALAPTMEDVGGFDPTSPHKPYDATATRRGFATSDPSGGSGAGAADPSGAAADPENRVSGYAVVWVQWVLNYLTDADLVAFLRGCGEALQAPHGRLVVKESVSRQERGFYVDHSDASITRTDAHFRQLFAEAGLQVVEGAPQAGMPRAIFPVFMYALERAA